MIPQHSCDVNFDRAIQTPDLFDSSGSPRRFPYPPGRARILLPALAVWACTALAVHYPNGGHILLLSGILCAILLIIFAWVGSEKLKTVTRLCGIFCALLLLVGASLTVHSDARQDKYLEARAKTHKQVTLQIRSESYPRIIAGDRPRTWVRATHIGSARTVPLLLFLDGPPPSGWALGSIMVITGTLQTAEPHNEHSFTMSVERWQHATPNTLDQHLPMKLAQGALLLREGVETLARRVPGAELVPGFAVGSTNGVPPAVNEQLTQVSLTHLTAVSGANCALVTGGVIAILRQIGARRKLRIVIAGAALLSFALIVGPDASMQRAAVMAGVILLSQFTGQSASSFPALGIAVITLLNLNPWQALSPGFALSVCATLGILLSAHAMSTWMQQKLRLHKVLALPLALTVSAQLACTPILLLLQPGISLVSVLANILAAPVAPIITALGLAATLLTPVLPQLAHTTMILASIPAKWVVATAQVTSSLPIPVMPWPGGWPGTLLYVLTAGLLASAWGLRTGKISLFGKQRANMRAPWHHKQIPQLGLRRVAATCTALGSALILATTAVTPLAVHATTPNNWMIVACDVGQGDALLLQNPNKPGDVVLIDTGDEPELLQRCLDQFGVRKITLLMLSHDDRDHIGALPQIIKIVETALIAPPTKEQITTGRPLNDTLQTAHIPVKIGSAGYKLTPAPGITAELLAPSLEPPPKNANAASLVAMFEILGTRILLTGDTGKTEQQQLLTLPNQQLHADILKVSHHGSRDQSRALAAAVGAKWALVSVGSQNSYGHPSKQTLSDIAAANTQILRTDLDGSIALVPGLPSSALDDSLVGERGAVHPWVTGPRRRYSCEAMRQNEGSRCDEQRPAMLRPHQ